ncbi:MAG: methionyl-tRNA formyltransferase [Pyrinomonadaceae bacterium]
MSSNKRYIVAGSRPWNRAVFDEAIATQPGGWRFVCKREELTIESIRSYDPAYIFFLHWSWKVPVEIINDYQCVCFHMTDVPYGRGGSPLQNLIVRGHHHTKLSALRMVDELDAGPVYMKEDLCLEGNAEEIYLRASKLSAQMIRTIIEQAPAPQPQTGEPTIFKRRRTDESRITGQPSLDMLYDFIRMLDAEQYPKAYLDHEGFRYVFSRASLYNGRIVAEVTINPTS